MRGDTLKRHMKRNEKKPYSIDESQTHRSGEMKNVNQAETSSAKYLQILIWKSWKGLLSVKWMSLKEKLSLEEI